MLSVMRDRKADWGRRDEMAKAAAPYVHPRFSSVQVPASDRTYDLSRLTDEELDAYEVLTSKCATVEAANSAGSKRLTEEPPLSFGATPDAFCRSR